MQKIGIIVSLLLIGIMLFGCTSPYPPIINITNSSLNQTNQTNTTSNQTNTIFNQTNATTNATSGTNSSANSSIPSPIANASANSSANSSTNSSTNSSANASNNASNASVGTMQLEEYNGGYFTIKKPVGWQIYQAGSCATFSFIMRDESRPERQVFYYGEVGPIYLAESQKQVDRGYRDMGGSLPTWYEMPVIDPLTPENFLQEFHLIADTNISKRFMLAPELENITIISSNSSQSPVLGETKTMRALFMQNGKLSEGMFYVTVAPLIPLTGYAWGGIGYAFSFIGISADKSEFKGMENDLTESIGSLTLSQEYVNNCLQQQDQQTQGILDAGKTLSETSDTIMSVWDNRNKVDDILSEKRSDVMLGNDRVYNPDTGTVYDVQNGFYDNYNINREKYDMSNLQQLPDNSWDLWTSATQPANEIH